MRAFRIVSYLFILSGASYLIDFFVQLILLRRITFDVGFIGIFIGRGLLRFERRWLTVAKWYTWAGLILLPAISMMLPSMSRLPFTCFGVPVGYIEYGEALAIFALWFLYLCWQLRVLGRSEIQERFVR